MGTTDYADGLDFAERILEDLSEIINHFTIYSGITLETNQQMAQFGYALADAFRLCDNVTVINDYGEETPTEIALLKATWKQQEGTYDYQWGVYSRIGSSKRKTSCRKRIERLVKENEDYFK